MASVNVTKSINVPAEDAWAKLSSFRGIEEFSPIARSVVEGDGAGATRTCYMPDDAAINEVLNLVDNNSMTMEYAITSGPFPITGYVSTVKVNAIDSESCEVSWGAEYEVSEEAAGEMKSLFEGFYNVIIESLESLIRNQN